MSIEEEISSEEVSSALERSGYLLEYRVEILCKALDFHVHSSAAYPDALTGKSREIDLLVRTGTCVPHPLKSNKIIASIAVEILIECENNPQPVCFFVKERRRFYNSLIHHAHNQTLVSVGNKSLKLMDALDPEAFHHYAIPLVATQYCSFQRKRSGDRRGTWQAAHTDSEFDSLQKLCDETSYIKRTSQELAGRKKRRDEPIYLTLVYPVLLLGGKIILSNPQGSSLNIREAGEIQFVRTVVQNGFMEEVNIDVVSEESLPRLLKEIRRELDEFSNRLASLCKP